MPQEAPSNAHSVDAIAADPMGTGAFGGALPDPCEEPLRRGNIVCVDSWASQALDQTGSAEHRGIA